MNPKNRFSTLCKRLARMSGSPQAPQPHPSLAHLWFLTVEISYCCNLKCKMCPRLSEGHKEGLMPLERFQRLEAILPFLKVVNLNGWGEPLLHPLLGKFTSMVRSAGARAHLTTNATLLDARKAEELLEAGLNDVQISIDGATKESYERIRPGAKWERVLINSCRFNQMIRERRADAHTAMVFVRMRSNFREMPQAVQLAADLGFPSFIAKLIDTDDSDYERQEALHDSSGRLLIDQAEHEEIEARCEEIARKNGVELRLLPFKLGVNGACCVNPTAGFYIDWTGNVVPCCLLPVRDGQGEVTQNIFGNIDRDDLLQVLLTPRAQKFWADWRQKRIPWHCRNCYQLARLPNRDELQLQD